VRVGEGVEGGAQGTSRGDRQGSPSGGMANAGLVNKILSLTDFAFVLAY